MFHRPALATRPPLGGRKALPTPWWTVEVRGLDLAVSAHTTPMRVSPSRTTPAGGRPPDPAGHHRHGSGPLIWFRGAVAANSLVRDDRHHGMLGLILGPTGWTQAFGTTDGDSRDAVNGRCRP